MAGLDPAIPAGPMHEHKTRMRGSSSRMTTIAASMAA
jgi:hypothetical protein